jgi:hypothetical protein
LFFQQQPQRLKKRLVRVGISLVSRVVVVAFIYEQSPPEMIAAPWLFHTRMRLYVGGGG